MLIVLFSQLFCMFVIFQNKMLRQKNQKNLYINMTVVTVPLCGKITGEIFPSFSFSIVYKMFAF